MKKKTKKKQRWNELFFWGGRAQRERESNGSNGGVVGPRVERCMYF